jgi:hypothetical protein
MIVEITPPPSFHEMSPARQPRAGPSINSSPCRAGSKTSDLSAKADGRPTADADHRAVAAFMSSTVLVCLKQGRGFNPRPFFELLSAVFSSPDRTVLTILAPLIALLLLTRLSDVLLVFRIRSFTRLLRTLSAFTICRHLVSLLAVIRVFEDRPRPPVPAIQLKLPGGRFIKRKD